MCYNVLIIPFKGETGVACAKTNMLIILAFYDESKRPGEATLAVEKTADKIREMGY